MSRILLLVSIVITSLATGCDAGGTHPVTDQEKKSFIGGPMPPDVRKKFEDSMAHTGPATGQTHMGPPGGTKPAGNG